MMNALKLLQPVATLQLLAILRYACKSGSCFCFSQLFLFQPVHVLIVPNGTAQFRDDSVV